MATVPEFDIQHRDPKLWVERIVIFESTEPLTAVREINLTRGLNIVWGVELPDDRPELSPVVLSGHSVGKTSLCRLIRYCLGEKHFGTKGSESRIKGRFPKGYVGMELHLDGERWAVARPFGGGNSRARKDCTIEVLFDFDTKQNQYRAFMDALRTTMISPLAVERAPGASRNFDWLHLLAWLARDQEARFQNLWDWRSPRSHSETPHLQKPKEDALYLIRAVLDLLNDRELDLTRKLEDLDRRIRESEQRIAELKKEPEFRLREQERLLEQLLGPERQPVADADDLLSLENQASRYQERLSLEMGRLQGEIEALGGQVAERQGLLAWYEEQQRARRAGLETVEETAEPPRLESEDEDLRRLHDLLTRVCLYGNIDFRDCQYFQQNLQEKEGERIVDFEKEREERRVEMAAEKRRANAERIRKELDELHSVVSRVRTVLQEELATKREKEAELAKLRAQFERLDYSIQEHRAARDLVEGRTPNTDLQRETTGLNEANEEREKKQEELEQVQSEYQERVTHVTRAYDALLKHVLSPTYSGVFRMLKGEPSFSISETTGLTGEAVETLALVLADVTAMLCSATGLGFHPRFLIHDSPREADLDRQIYNRFLSAVAGISADMGGSQGAPFQHIITTTSRPPDKLLDSEVMKLRLEAHPETKMLFGCQLVSPDAADLPDLFEVQKDEGEDTPRD